MISRLTESVSLIITLLLFIGEGRLYGQGLPILYLKE
jgi:hypothetical protein